jgi:hypothetical protein
VFKNGGEKESHAHPDPSSHTGFNRSFSMSIALMLSKIPFDSVGYRSG